MKQTAPNAQASGAATTSRWREILLPCVTLFIICVAVALLLALTNAVTAPKIEQLRIQTEEGARKVVLPSAQAFSDEKKLTLDDAEYIYFEGLDAAGGLTGYVFTTSAKGYGGDVVIMTGVDSAGAVTGIQTLELNETAGLGMKAKEESFLRQYRGKRAPIGVEKNKPGENDIQALTGATITSKAITDSVNTALALYAAVQGGAQG